jgi:hypothetical protein
MECKHLSWTRNNIITLLFLNLWNIPTTRWALALIVIVELRSYGASHSLQSRWECWMSSWPSNDVGERRRADKTRWDDKWRSRCDRLKQLAEPNVSFWQAPKAVTTGFHVGEACDSAHKKSRRFSLLIEHHKRIRSMNKKARYFF